MPKQIDSRLSKYFTLLKGTQLAYPLLFVLHGVYLYFSTTLAALQWVSVEFLFGIEGIAVSVTILFLWPKKKSNLKVKSERLRSFAQQDSLSRWPLLLACFPTTWFFLALPESWVLFPLFVVKASAVVFLFRSISTHAQIERFVRLFFTILFSYLLIHFIACIWMSLTMPADQIVADSKTSYNLALYWTITTLTTIGYGDITPTTNASRLFTMMIMILGVGSYGLIIGSLSRIIIMADRHREEKREKMNDLQTFFKHYSIPQAARQQVFGFYHHLLDKRLNERDRQIIGELPQALRQELEVYMKIKLMKGLPLFERVSSACLKQIAQCLEQRLFSPGDLIVRSGDVGKEMYVVAHGNVEVSDEEKVLAVLGPGEFFGEVALLQDSTRTADVRARSYCDLYILNQDSFAQLTQKYTELKTIFLETKEQRVRLIKRNTA